MGKFKIPQEHWRYRKIYFNTMTLVFRIINGKITKRTGERYIQWCRFRNKYFKKQ